jgi:hypothetical protein
MDIAVVKTFFMWCSIINGALLVISFLICTSAGDWIYQMHSKWFPIPRETFNVVIYCFLGLYKIFFIVFNLVPFIAIVIIG